MGVETREEAFLREENLKLRSENRRLCRLIDEYSRIDEQHFELENTWVKEYKELKSKLNIRTNSLKEFIKIMENGLMFQDERCRFCRGHIRYPMEKSFSYTEEYPENHENNCPISKARKALQEDE